MSIINQMYQDFEKSQHAQPVLSGMPKKNNKKKLAIIFFIILLIGSSLGLSYLIFTQNNGLADPSLVSAPPSIDEGNNKRLVAPPSNANAPLESVEQTSAITPPSMNQVATPEKNSLRSLITSHLSHWLNLNLNLNLKLNLKYNLLSQRKQTR
ncbi:hypothetical protein [Psychromonas sp. MME2]|uniref:hypothetical protein n=1 Tax=Psychromonas sp. MME2 TaxID=3231033 RepID=UPI00339BBA1D